MGAETIQYLTSGNGATGCLQENVISWGCVVPGALSGCPDTWGIASCTAVSLVFRWCNQNCKAHKLPQPVGHGTGYGFQIEHFDMKCFLGCCPYIGHRQCIPTCSPTDVQSIREQLNVWFCRGNWCYPQNIVCWRPPLDILLRRGKRGIHKFLVKGLKSQCWEMQCRASQCVAVPEEPVFLWTQRDRAGFATYEHIILGWAGMSESVLWSCDTGAE